MFALDTNTLIYFFKGKGRVADNLLARAPAEIAIPAIVAYEIETGIAKSPARETRRRQFDELLDLVTLWPFGKPELVQAAAIRAELESSGSPIGPIDTLIAATALANRATLVTHNTREFERVPGLVVTDWL